MCVRLGRGYCLLNELSTTRLAGKFQLTMKQKELKIPWFRKPQTGENPSRKTNVFNMLEFIFVCSEFYDANVLWKGSNTMKTTNMAKQQPKGLKCFLR